MKSVAARLDLLMQRTVATQRSRPLVLLCGTIAICAIAYADLRLGDAIPLSPLYLLPVVIMSTVLQRWQIVVLGVLCTLVAEYSDSFAWNLGEGLPRDALYCFAYSAVGLYVHEVFSRRRAEQAHAAALEAEIEARRGIEEHLRLVVANSSIAIVTADESGTILETNDAAEQLWAGERRLSGSSLKGMPMSNFVPSLARAAVGRQGLERLRTMMQCQGFRANEGPFLADVWFSTYTSSQGGRLTAMIIDSSNETRDREQANLEQVLVGSRIALGALSHEIRNICAAISVVQQNLLVNALGDRQVQEFDALRQLVEALERMASAELSLVKRQATPLNLDTFLGDLYVVVNASLRDAGIGLDWDIQPGLPAVWADSPSLMQVFLNLIRNAETAFANVSGGIDPVVRIAARRDGDIVHIAVADNGPGVAEPDKLFRPFGQKGGASGLGLYLSRAMMRSFHGELRYDPGSPGAAFLLDLNVAEVDE